MQPVTTHEGCTLYKTGYPVLKGLVVNPKRGQTVLFEDWSDARHYCEWDGESSCFFFLASVKQLTHTEKKCN